MRSSQVIRLVLAFAAVCLALTLATCGSHKRSVVQGLRAPEASFSPGSSSDGSGSLQAADYPADEPASQPLDSALAELDALKAPAGVDPALFAELKSALAALLTTNSQKLTTGRFASTPPTGESNKITDLEIHDNGDGTYTLTWHYRNLGDYDQDGTVAIEDIIPLAEHFGEEVPDDNDNSLQDVIDGSGNGVIEIADITPLAMNLGVDCAGYMIMESESLDGEWQEAGSIALEEAIGDGRLEFTYSNFTPGAGMLYVAVVPSDAYANQGVISSPAEMPITEWVHTWGGSGDDVCNAVAVDSHGNTCFVGYTNSFGAGGYDALVGKFDVIGNLLWVKTWGGSENDYAKAITIDDTGNLYVTGSTQSFGDNEYDLILLKYDPEGNLLFQKTWFQKTWGYGGRQGGSGVAVDASGMVLVTGHAARYGGSAYATILVVFESNGDPVWSYGPWNATIWSEDYGNDIAIDRSGAIYITGRSYIRYSDIVLFKFNQWRRLSRLRTWGGEKTEEGSAIAIDEVGNVYVAGSTRSFGAGWADIVLLKYSPEGDVLWQKTWGRSGDQIGQDIAIDSSGHVWITGHTKPYAFLPLLEYDCDGNLLQQKVWRTSDIVAGTSIAIGCRGAVHIGGFARSAFGWWENAVDSQESSPTGGETSPEGRKDYRPGWGSGTPGGIETSPMGILDEGAGGLVDAFVMKHDPSRL